MSKKMLCLLAGLMLLAGCFFLTGHGSTAMAEEEAEVNTLATVKQGDVAIVVGRTRTLTISYDKSVKKTDAKVYWTSEDESVVAVSTKGNITGVGPGEAKVQCEITLKNGDLLYAESVVTVIQPVEKILIETESPVTVGSGTRTSLVWQVEPENASNPAVEWSSSDESIATVDENGVVQGVKAGRARITAKAADEYNASASIEVQVSPLYADANEVTIDDPGTVRMRVHFEGDDFEDSFEVIQEGEAFTYTMRTLASTAIFRLKPVAVTEENHLIIRDRKNPQQQVDILVKVTDNAIVNSQKLPVVSAELLSGTGALTYRFEVTNNAAEEIGEIGFLVDYRDQFGDTHYLFSNNDGTIQNFNYTTMFNILPGETKPLIGRTEAFRSDDVITEVRLAINYYRYVDSGAKVYIPDSQLYWYSSKTGEMERPEIEATYEQPDVDTTDKADRITYNLRATMCDLYTYVVKPFSRSYRPGKYIAVLGADGYASAWGLKAQDVIYGADDMLWVNDPFFLNRAFAKVYDGETVTLMVVRNGEEIEIPIKKDLDSEEQ